MAYQSEVFQQVRDELDIVKIRLEDYCKRIEETPSRDEFDGITAIAATALLQVTVHCLEGACIALDTLIRQDNISRGGGG
jgi:hypothetical protein